MKVIILYDTKYGNTEKVAKAISEGMKEVGFGEVTVKSGSETTPQELREAGVWIFGSPTHIGTTTRNFKRLIRWMKKERPVGKKGVAFDTRLEKSRRGASDKLVHVMQALEIEILDGPFYFRVKDVKGPLITGELEKATTLGRKLAGQIREIAN